MIDIQSIMTDALSRLLDLFIIGIAPIFIIAVFTFIFIDYVAFYLDIEWERRNKLFWQSLGFALLSGIPVVIYLIKHQHIFFLSLLTSVILTYILYIVGIADMIIEKLEGKHGGY